MYKIETTLSFDRWFAKLRDAVGKSAIDLRLRRLRRGNPGDARFVGSGVLELRIDVCPGYRVYYMRRKELVLVLLAGGDKRTKDRDIEKAIELATIIGSAR